MKQQVMFYVLFESNSSKHNRMHVFDEPKDLHDFQDWIYDERIKLESDIKKKVIIKDLKFITHTSV